MNDSIKILLKPFQDEFFTPSGRLAARTQTAHILALMLELVPKEHRERTVDTLLALLDENEGHLYMLRRGLKSRNRFRNIPF